MAGLGDQAKGKANEILGKVTNDTGQQIKGKAQQEVGKLKQRMSRDDNHATSDTNKKRPAEGDMRNDMSKHP